MQYGLAQVVNSGNGPYIDFKFAKKAEVFAWGGYKGKLHTALVDAAGTSVVNGMEVYNSIPLMGKISNKDTPESRVLELLGIGDDDRDKIISGYAKGVKSVTLNWDSRPAVSGNRLEQELKMIRRAIDGYDKIVVTQDWRRVSNANRNTTNYGFTWQQGVDRDTMEYSLVTNVLTPKPPQPNPDNFIWDKTNLIDKYDIHLVRTDGTMDVPDKQIREAILALILLSNGKAFAKIHSEHHFRDEGGGYATILTKEDYEAKIDVTAIAQDIDVYADKVGSEYVIIESGTNASMDNFDVPIPRYWYHVWVSEQIDGKTPPVWSLPVTSPGMNDLFKTTQGLFTEKDGVRYLVVQGLRQCQPSQFVWVSAFANIEFKAKKGGFVKRFVGGLIKGITSFINTIVEVLFKVPVLAFMFSSILAMLVIAGKAIGGDVELMMKSILKTIIASAMLYYAPQMLGFEAGAMGGASIAGVELGSLSGLSTLANMGISASSNFQEYKWSEEQSEYEWEEPEDTDMFAEIKELDVEGREDPNSWEQMYFLQYTGMFDVGFMFELQNTVRIPEYGRKKV